VGIVASELRRIRQLEEENRKRKKIVADLSLEITRSGRKRGSGVRVIRPGTTVPNGRWSMDFISVSLHDGHRFRVLTLVDHITRESPAIEVGSSIPGERVIDILERLASPTGLPKIITVDNGPCLPGEHSLTAQLLGEQNAPRVL
jgi:transposase InsO family protein